MIDVSEHLDSLDVPDELTEQLDVLRSDHGAIEELEASPPEVILVHIYGSYTNTKGAECLNVESRYLTKAVCRLIHHFHDFAEVSGEQGQISKYHPTIVVCGGEERSAGQDNSLGIFASSIQKGLEGLPLDIWSEGRYISGRFDYRKAVETRGELRFARHIIDMKGLPADTRLLSISRMGHQQRIALIGQSFGLNTVTLTAEGILSYFTSDAVVEKFIRMYPDYIQSMITFSSAEARKRLAMSLFDPTGSRIEWLVRNLGGEIKRLMFLFLGQQAVKQ